MHFFTKSNGPLKNLGNYMDKRNFSTEYQMYFITDVSF